MDDRANDRSHWSLQDNVGRLAYGPLFGEVDAARPYMGLSVPEFNTDRVVCALLGAYRGDDSFPADALQRANHNRCWPLPVAETYVRGNDLVATYRPIDSWPYSPQLYWRTETLDAIEDVVASMSLLVSVQTQLLDTCPQISVLSQAPSKETLRIAVDENGIADVEPIGLDEHKVPTGSVCCIIRRLLTATLSYVEFMSASDYFEVQIRRPDAKGDSLTEWRLFADFLEKGVIRRARVHGALLPQKNDIELALECCRAIEKSPLPLTT